MKKILILFSILLLGSQSYAFYDFCQSPQAYNTFPAAYDMRTEYWKDIPNHNENKIQMKKPEVNLKGRTIIKEESSVEETKVIELKQ